MILDVFVPLLIVATAAWIMWIGLGALATWLDTRDDDEPDNDEREPR